MQLLCALMPPLIPEKGKKYPRASPLMACEKGGKFNIQYNGRHGREREGGVPRKRPLKGKTESSRDGRRGPKARIRR